MALEVSVVTIHPNDIGRLANSLYVHFAAKEVVPVRFDSRLVRVRRLFIELTRPIDGLLVFKLHEDAAGLLESVERFSIR